MVDVCNQCYEEYSGDEEGLCRTCSKDEHEPQCYFDSLPDELLVKVLSMVPTVEVRHFKALLALRLVSRRFNEALARPAVWRHRTFKVHEESHVHVLASVPVLDHVEILLPCRKGRMRHSHAEFDRRQETLAGLVWTRTKVRSMKLSFGINDQISRLASQLLKFRFMTLEDLNFRLDRAIISHPWPVLEALNGMKNLKKLTLGPVVRHDKNEIICWDEVGSVDPDQPGRRFYRLSNLTSLEELAIETNVSQTLVTSLLDASKDSLQVVRCPRYDITSKLAACSLLREAEVMASETLSRLRDHSKLRTLTVHCSGRASELSCLENFLDSPKSQPPVVRVHLTGLDSTDALLQVTPSLQRVRFLRIVGQGTWRHPSEFPICLAGMDALEELELDAFFHSTVRYMLEGMDDSVAPKLKRVAVSSTAKPIVQGLFKETRPHLEVAGRF